MSPASEDHSEDSPSEDELLEELERELDDDFDLGGFREKRLQQLKLEVAAVRDLRENDHGKYTEVTREKQVIEICALVGFDELGNQDEFDTATLQLRLQMSGVLTNSESKFGLTSGSTIRTSSREYDDDDPFDLDE